MFLNNIRFFLRESIPSSQSTGTYNVSTEFEQDGVINTNGATVSVTLRNSTQIERFECTFANGQMTVLRRGLDQSATVTPNSDLQRQWIEGSIGVITVFASDIFDAQEDIDLSATQRINFGDTDVYLVRDGNGNLTFKDVNNSLRTLQDLSASGSNDQVRVTTNDTTAGVLNNKVVAGNGIEKSTINPGLDEDLQISARVSTTNGLRIENGEIDINPASNSQVGSQRISTDPEATAGVLETVTVNPKQLVEALPVQPATTTTYFNQGTEDIVNTTRTYTFNVTKNGTYRVAISFSQSVSGGGGNMHITTDNIRIPVWSTDAVGSKTLGDNVGFSSGESSNETYFVEGIAGTSIQVVGTAGSQALTVNSILITGT